MEVTTPLQDERFLMLEALGRGGMGTVYRAFDRAEQRLVALKVPCEAAPAGPAHPLSEEFDRWTQLKHPNIVRAYELGHAERGPLPRGTPYLVLEHVRGRPANQVFPAGRTSESVVEDLAVHVLSALAHVHATGFVHRDLKPGNVLACAGPGRRARFKLTDFGLASRIGEGNGVGIFSGSLPYVAPEALLGARLDGRADLYGLGVLLYRIVTGEMPVCGGPREVLEWHLKGPDADPSRTRPGLSPRLARFICRLTMRRRGDRPPSAIRALEMLDVRLPATARCEPVAVAARGTLASLRLALDAVRLGAQRVFHLPQPARTDDALLRELSVWSQVRGVRFHRVPGEVDRLVLRLLAERGANGAELTRHFSLRRWLPLETMGQLVLLDPSRAGARAPALRPAARAIADLILDCASNRPLVLCFDRTADAPLVNAVRQQLVRVLDRTPPRTQAGGGLLLVI